MRRKTRGVALALVLALGTTGGVGPASAAAATAGSGVGAGGVTKAGAVATAGATADQQLRWFLDASGRAPVSAAEQGEHLSAAFLAAIGGPDTVNQVLADTGRLRADTVPAGERLARVIATGAGARFLLTVHTDGAGLIDGLTLARYPRSWSELDGQLRALAPRASFVAAVVDPRGRCRVVHGVDPDAQRPLGSAFKLYVLGALAHAVAGGRASWDERLAVREEWKSLPSGRMQELPAGTELTLREYAEAMISISDNTATDHLIRRLGRPAVEAQLLRFGHRRPAANLPLPTTRDLFVLKGHRYPAGADAYVALPRGQRAAALAANDRVPLSSVAPWQEPRHIDQVEWFGSPNDMCRAFAGLARQHADPRLSAVGPALSTGRESNPLSPSAYPTVWFKGGSEPGVLTLNYLVRTATGQTVVTSVMLSDPAAALVPGALENATALALAGIELASAR